MLEAKRRHALTVVVADDHLLVRQGLRMVLDSESDLEVVADCGTCQEALEAADRYHPDVLLLDMHMPLGGGVTACRNVVARCPDTHVVILSGFEDDADVVGAMEAGATGYLLKDVPSESLIASIRDAARGNMVLAPSIARRLFHLRPRRGTVDSAETLSERESEVLRLMARGMRNGDIARTLWISESTVKTHVGRIMAKLGQRDRLQAVLHAIGIGLVEVDGPSSARVQ